MRFRVTDCCLLVPNVDRSVEFYRDRLGLRLKRRDIGFAEFDIEGATLALWEASDVQRHLGKDAVSNEGHWFMGAFEFQSAEALLDAYNQFKSRGVTFVKEPRDWPWGARAAYFKDPDGYLWEIYAWVGKPYTW
jgi:catechol 2,3-dioxygenase-like lactoylglutathione lyase family enzyme